MAAPAPFDVSLTAEPEQVEPGGTVWLRWQSGDGITACKATGGWSGLKDSSGTEQVTVDETKTYGLDCVGTVSASATVAAITPPPIPPPSKLVVGINPQAHTGGMNESGKAFLQELKPHSLRLGIGQPGYMDRVNWAVQNNMGVLFGFGYGEGCNVLTAEGRQCYADRSARVAQEVGDKAQYFSIWNEWNGGFGFGGLCGNGKPPCNDAAMYTDLLCRTHKAVKAVRPSARIAGGVIAGANEEFLRGMLDAGAADCMDVVDLHLYVYRDGWPGHVPANAPGSVGADKFIQTVNERQKLVLQKTGRNIPIIATEVGFHGTSEEVEADYVAELYKRAATVPFLEGIWWFQLRQHKRVGGDISQHGLVRNNDTKTPAFETFKAAAAKTN